MSTDGKYDGVDLLPAFQHKFISYYDALGIHRLLLRGTRTHNSSQETRYTGNGDIGRDLRTKITNLRRTISLETRFPENELFYDLNESVLGSVFSHIVNDYRNPPMYSTESIKYTDENYKKFESKVFHILTMQSTDDPLRGVYTRQSFEKKYNLYFNGAHYTLMRDYLQ